MDLQTGIWFLNMSYSLTLIPAKFSKSSLSKTDYKAITQLLTVKRTGVFKVSESSLKHWATSLHVHQTTELHRETDLYARCEAWRMFPICRLSDQKCVIAAGIAVGFMKLKPAYSVPTKLGIISSTKAVALAWCSWWKDLLGILMYKHALCCNNKNTWDCLFYKRKRFISLHGFGSWKTQGQVVTAGGGLYCFIIWKVGSCVRRAVRGIAKEDMLETRGGVSRSKCVLLWEDH